jgi:hypothetical protein
MQLIIFQNLANRQLTFLDFQSKYRLTMDSSTPFQPAPKTETPQLPMSSGEALAKFFSSLGDSTETSIGPRVTQSFHRHYEAYMEPRYLPFNPHAHIYEQLIFSRGRDIRLPTPESICQPLYFLPNVNLSFEVTTPRREMPGFFLVPDSNEIRSEDAPKFVDNLEAMDRSHPLDFGEYSVSDVNPSRKITQSKEVKIRVFATSNSKEIRLDKIISMIVEAPPSSSGRMDALRFLEELAEFKGHLINLKDLKLSGFDMGIFSEHSHIHPKEMISSLLHQLKHDWFHWKCPDFLFNCPKNLATWGIKKLHMEIRPDISDFIELPPLPTLLEEFSFHLPDIPRVGVCVFIGGPKRFTQDYHCGNLKKM